MVDRIKAAVDSRGDDDFVVMARTDAVASEGLEAGIDRANSYVRAGADMVFAEALGSAADFARFCREVDAPILANLTEFGKTPLLSLDELRHAGVRMALYPLSAFRAMSAAALAVYGAIRRDGNQARVVDRMQTRSELYEVLDYHRYEQKLDELYRKES
jgi:methylisocitrate lyase